MKYQDFIGDVNIEARLIIPCTVVQGVILPNLMFERLPKSGLRKIFQLSSLISYNASEVGFVHFPNEERLRYYATRIENEKDSEVGHFPFEPASFVEFVTSFLVGESLTLLLNSRTIVKSPLPLSLASEIRSCSTDFAIPPNITVENSAPCLSLIVDKHELWNFNFRHAVLRGLKTHIYIMDTTSEIRYAIHRLGNDALELGSVSSIAKIIQLAWRIFVGSQGEGLKRASESEVRIPPPTGE